MGPLKPKNYVNHPFQATIPKEKFGTVDSNIYPHDFGIDSVYDAGSVLGASSSLEVLDAEKTTRWAEPYPLTEKYSQESDSAPSRFV